MPAKLHFSGLYRIGGDGEHTDAEMSAVISQQVQTIVNETAAIYPDSVTLADSFAVTISEFPAAVHFSGVYHIVASEDRSEYEMSAVISQEVQDRTGAVAGSYDGITVDGFLVTSTAVAP